MSDEASELSGDEALAAEHALGVLSGRERAEAEARMAADPAFAREVEAWRERLAPMLDAFDPVAPPAGVWPAIERTLPANDDVADLRRRLRIWRRAGVGALGLMAASLIAVVALVADRPSGLVQPPAAATAPLLNANLATEAGQRLFVAAYDPDRQALIITSLAPPEAHPGREHELWLIPADGRPRSLGLVPRGATRSVSMGDLAPLTAEGTRLAISVEPPGGSTGEGPSGPVAATGELARI